MYVILSQSNFEQITTIMKNLFSIILITLICSLGFSQNVGINTTGAVPNLSALLDISATNKGVLIPRIIIDSIGDLSTIASPANALLIYNTNNSFTNGLQGDGFYYNEGSSTVPHWVRLITNNNDAWSLLGNIATTNNNFIGTTDNKRLLFKVNNLKAGLIDSLNGNNNTFFGLNAGFSVNNTAYSNTIIGNEAGRSMITSDNNVMIGDSAGFANNNSNVIMIGAGAGRKATGFNSVFIGSKAGYNNILARNNIAIGNLSLYKNVTGNKNLAIGDSAGYEHQSENSMYIGFCAGRNANPTFGENLFIGTMCGYASTTGSGNTFIGTYAAENNETGSGNVFIGKRVAQNNTIGNDNLIIGTYGAPSFDRGIQNVIVGNSTAQNLIYGNRNVIVGDDAGDNVTRNDNTLIGNKSDLADSTLINATAVGAKASVNASNSLVLGSISGINGATQTVSVGIATERPVSRLDDSGSLGLAIRTTTASTTFNINDHTVLLISGANTNVTFDLPLPNSCKRREYVIVNHNVISASRVFDISYIDFNGAAISTIPTGAITIQSDGINWYRIR